ncbi:MAG: hypothetical protein A3C71_01025 [Candidatus Yanofskybacteria bacterium RIFCSPHIGHO2_02_FULL_43_15c]|uniref:Uncharacterized protein n=1 Tax=Candidatus Yanofskybacteria bacterium RIFCSPHIGHO2_02_FULL_43_15c TaxID=1802679 RepID=A0A1F8FID1_9BACT|nr:MAG: hypothetical protein A3C71_01025 [Candidatus Yanofskybacteria bacterium RIFCSPHIGHO2_02_FULL_43_15c]
MIYLCDGAVLIRNVSMIVMLLGAVMFVFAILFNVLKLHNFYGTINREHMTIKESLFLIIAAPITGIAKGYLRSWSNISKVSTKSLVAYIVITVLGFIIFWNSNLISGILFTCKI